MSTHQEYVDGLKAVFESKLRDQILKYLLEKFTFLAWGPLNAIVVKLTVELAEYIVKQAETGIFFKYIDLRVDSQGKALSDAIAANIKIQQTGTPDEKIKAEKELAEKFKSFVVFTS